MSEYIEKNANRIIGLLSDEDQQILREWMASQVKHETTSAVNTHKYVGVTLDILLVIIAITFVGSVGIAGSKFIFEKGPDDYEEAIRLLKDENDQLESDKELLVRHIARQDRALKSLLSGDTTEAKIKEIESGIRETSNSAGP